MSRAQLLNEMTIRVMILTGRREPIAGAIAIELIDGAEDDVVDLEALPPAELAGRIYRAAKVVDQARRVAGLGLDRDETEGGGL